MAGAGLSLEELRREIELRDRALVLLLAERIHLARRAIHLRTSTGAPVTDPGQERRVLERARTWAVECGIAPALVDRLFREIIDRGKSEPGPGARPP